MPTFTANQVVEISAALFEAAGAPRDRAYTVAQHLADANLCGHDSHGIQNLVALVSLVRDGTIKPAADWKVVKETSSTAVIDGGWGFGQVVCQEAVGVAAQKAKSVGSSSVGVLNCTHIGRLGAYTTSIAEQGLIGIIYANSFPGVAPYGGKTKVLGTNPLSFAFPTRDSDPILVDFATSVVAAGKVRAAKNRGEKIPQGWVLDREGKPTQDPEDLFSGGVLLPAAGHKGYSLAVVVDLLGGALTGAGTGMKVGKAINGVFLQAIDPECFASKGQYLENLERLIAEIRAAVPAEGFSEILLPGEPESRSRRKRLAEGIEVPEIAWQEIARVAKELSVNLAPFAPTASY